MKQDRVSGTDKALIFFADIIDSSQYSSILGIEEYAKFVIDFQKTFTSLAYNYFPKHQKSLSNYSEISANGDQGIIFYINHDKQQYELIYDAIKFAFELKGRMEFKAEFVAEPNSSPKKMKIAIGIHYGPVAKISEKPDTQSINRIEGYSINYAKRVESTARMGKFSKIFLSPEAASLISSDPIILIQHIADLKGIAYKEIMYEVRSAAFFDDFPKDIENLNIHNFIKNEAKGEYQLDLVREPWLKGYILSVLHNISSDNNSVYDYKQRISKLIWGNITEDDPLLLLMRVYECNREEKHTKSIEYLKKIIIDFPYFFHAKIEFIKTIIFMKQEDENYENTDFIYAKDLANEILEKFPQIISPQEKESFKNL